jgi:hypothetical protein
MPKAALTTGAFRSDNGVEKFEPLKLDTNQTARAWIPDEDNAWMEYVHTLRVPQFEDSGEPLMAEKKSRGIVREVFDTAFLGRPICLGHEEVIAAQELDPETCPACAGIKEMLDAGIGDARDLRPQRRYAVPLVVYNTQRKTSADKLQTPPGGKIVVWSMSQWTYEKLDKVHGQITELFDLDEGVQTKLQQVDIAIRCENGGWQSIDTVTAMRPAWRDNAVKDMIRLLWGTKENRPTDEQLRAACGREPDRDWMHRDIADVKDAWERAVHWGDGGPLDASRGGRMSGANGSGRNLDEALDGLLGETPASDPLDGHPGGLAEFSGAKTAAAAADDDLFGSPADSAPAASGPAPSWPSDDDLFGSAPAETVGADAPPPAAPPAAPADDDMFASPGNSAEAALGDGPKESAAVAAPKAGAVASFDDIMPADVPA